MKSFFQAIHMYIPNTVLKDGQTTLRQYIFFRQVTYKTTNQMFYKFTNLINQAYILC